ncbi:hypothetical protein [Sinorhizobium sp. 22678]|uniref:hypothetical protein n=1 Tax=Sinorhizobium sp. 22678 TaxID=3453955 RepID=UPI003F86BD6A
MNLTWNQKRAIERLVERGFQGTVREIAEGPNPSGKYLCGSAARSALESLVKLKGLAVVTRFNPKVYLLTEAGREAYSEIVMASLDKAQ